MNTHSIVIKSFLYTAHRKQYLLVLNLAKVHFKVASLRTSEIPQQSQRLTVLFPMPLEYYPELSF